MTSLREVIVGKGCSQPKSTQERMGRSEDLRNKSFNLSLFHPNLLIVNWQSEAREPTEVAFTVYRSCRRSGSTNKR